MEKGGSRSRTALIACVLLAAAFGGMHLATRDDEDLDEVVVEDVEAAAEHATDATAWKAADRGLREQFALAYRSSEDKKAVFEKYAPQLGAPALLDFLELTYPLCHEQAHDLGTVLFAQARNLGASLGVCATRCTSGCMHGVLAQALQRTSYEDVTARLDDVCASPELARAYKAGNCAHGIGHALMRATRNQLNRALEGCSRFSVLGMEYYCATGVYMEFRAQRRAAEDRGAPVERPTLHFPCDQEARFPAACYRYMLRSIRSVLGANRQRLQEECNTLPDRQRTGCFHGLGATYARSIAKHPARLSELCAVGRPDDAVVCIEGVIEKLADFDERRAQEACAMLAGSIESVCRAAAEGKMYRLQKPSLHLYTGGSRT